MDCRQPLTARGTPFALVWDCSNSAEPGCPVLRRDSLKFVAEELRKAIDRQGTRGVFQIATAEEEGSCAPLAAAGKTCIEGETFLKSAGPVRAETT